MPSPFGREEMSTDELLGAVDNTKAVMPAPILAGQEAFHRIDPRRELSSIRFLWEGVNWKFTG